jgi:polyisoprenoid-binding protein YceI
MKWFISIVVLATIAISSCQQQSPKTETQAEVVAEAPVDAAQTAWEKAFQAAEISQNAAKPLQASKSSKIFKADPGASSIGWKGARLAYFHYGSVAMKEGMIAVDNAKPVAGKFVMDLSTISSEDQKDPGDKAKLEGHLKSADFFDVEKYPEATFEISKIEPVVDNNYMISGNLSMKGVSKEITFPGKITISDAGVEAEAEFSVDRTEWGVNFDSGNVFKDVVADKIISDNISFRVKIAAK